MEIKVTGRKIWKLNAGFCSENVTHRTGRKMGLGSGFEKNIAVFDLCLLRHLCNLIFDGEVRLCPLESSGFLLLFSVLNYSSNSILEFT